MEENKQIEKSCSEEDEVSENEEEVENNADLESESSSESTESKESAGECENKIAGTLFGKGTKGFIDDSKSVISGVDNSDVDDEFLHGPQDASDDEVDEDDDEAELRLTSSDDEDGNG